MAQSTTKSGTIDLPGLFEAEAERLLVAVTRGRLLHQTSNIRDAGAPLEAEFRMFLGKRLPARYSVTHGYLFDPNSKCTPQIDAIIVDGEESHELMRSDEGAAYVPYPSGRTIFEIKNSSRGLASHIRQVTTVAAAVAQMRTDAIALRGQSAPTYTETPLTVLIVGDSSTAKIATFKKLYTSRLDHPKYTLLLDRGLLIARDTVLSEFISFDTGLDFYSYRQRGSSWKVWEPKSSDKRRGHALLWLYFAVVAQLNLSKGNAGSIIDFTNQIARDFPMVERSQLNTATKW